MYGIFLEDVSVFFVLGLEVSNKKALLHSKQGLFRVQVYLYDSYMFKQI